MRSRKMIRRVILPAFSGMFLGIAGCGQQAREETISRLNIEADRWDGGGSFQSSEKDAWGGPLYWKVSEGKLTRQLELGSPGPDGLAKNSDDLVVLREKTVFSIQGAAKAAASGTIEGTIKGAVDGAKAGIETLWKKDDPQSAPAAGGKE
jgi:hypothetical protein